MRRAKLFTNKVSRPSIPPKRWPRTRHVRLVSIRSAKAAAPLRDPNEVTVRLSPEVRKQPPLREPKEVTVSLCLVSIRSATVAAPLGDPKEVTLSQHDWGNVTLSHQREEQQLKASLVPIRE